MDRSILHVYCELFILVSIEYFYDNRLKIKLKFAFASEFLENIQEYSIRYCIFLRVRRFIFTKDGIRSFIQANIFGENRKY